MIIIKDTKSIFDGSEPSLIAVNGVAYTDNEVFIVAEDSDIAKKAVAHFPDFDFVIDDEEALIDIVAVPHVATEAENRSRYEDLVVEKIRERYSQNDEYKILREALASGTFDDFDTYNSYVEQCKAAAWKIVYGEERT